MAARQAKTLILAERFFVSTRLWSVLFALILVNSQCVFSQEIAAEKKNLATLQGRVANSVTGEPFPRESLTLRELPPGTDAWVVQSDAEGRFSFAEMKPGSYILCVRRFGDDGMPLKLLAGQVLKDIEFKIIPPGAIRGIVVDDEGNPLPNVRVRASGGVAGLLRGDVPTNKAGEFRFPSLVPGSYVLLATATEGRLAPAAPASDGEPGKAEERLRPTYYPSAADAAGAVPLEVAPGQELQDIWIVVRKGGVHHVQGTVVTSSPDTPLVDVRLSMRPRAPGPPESADAELRRDGSFDFGDVRPGSYDLIAWRRTPAPTVTLGRAAVEVNDADVTGVVLRIKAPLQVQGTMRMEGQDKPDFTSVRVQLAGQLRGATPDAENIFTLKDVPPDRQLVVVTGLPERAYVKSIRLGGLETIDSGLDLSGMQTVPPLDILISPNGATVVGTVNQDDDKPVPGAWVCLVPDPARQGLISMIKSATSNGDGGFTFAGVAPGDYRLYAFERLTRTPYGSLGVEFLKPLEDKATKLTLKEGERKHANPKALELAEIGPGGQSNF